MHGRGRLSKDAWRKDSWGLFLCANTEIFLRDFPTFETQGNGVEHPWPKAYRSGNTQPYAIELKRTRLLKIELLVIVFSQRR